MTTPSQNKSIKNSALITGAAKRVGAHLAKTLAMEGFNLYLHYFNSQDEVLELKKKLLANFDIKVKCIKGELIKSPQSLITKCQGIGNLQILVNNASSFLTGNFADAKNFKDQLAVNALTPLTLSQSFYEQAIPGSSIINITDANAQSINKSYQNYRISKRILTEITRETAISYAPKVRVNAIAPGAILPAAGDTKKQFLEKINRAPLKYPPGLESISMCLKFILDSHFLTGQILYADSGMHLIS